VEATGALVEAALEKALSSQALQGAPRLRRLLAYLVRHALAGEEHGPKEYTIGVEVFDRGARFDPRCDAIVRVQVLKLREKLQRYYATEGSVDQVSISIPKGSYRPVFEIHEAPLGAILEDLDSLCGQAHALLLRCTPDAIRRARRYLMGATRRWPTRSEPHVALAEATLVALEMELMAPSEGLPMLQCAAATALQLDPSSAEAHFYGGVARGWHTAAALSATRRAFALRRRNAIARYRASSVLAANGEFGEAMIHLREAVRLEPAAVFLRTWTAVLLHCAGNAVVARHHLLDVLEFEPHDYLAHFWLGRICASLGFHDEARQAGTRAYDISGSTQALCSLGYIEASAGRVEPAETILHELATRSQTTYIALSGVAGIHLALRQPELTATVLAQARRQGDWDLAWARIDPRWTPIRGKLAGF
jgi:Flp pilus assembly protein TadD